MTSDFSSLPPPPTPAQLAEIDDALVTAAELQQVYAALLRHPRVLATPGSSEVFAACRDQACQDVALLAAQAAGLQALVAPTLEPEMEMTEEDGIPVLPPRSVTLPDVEPCDPRRPIFETVRKAFHLEDFFRQQVLIAVQSARAQRHLPLELKLKMVLLSAEQRCRLLEERYGFARTGHILFQGLRRQTTRFLQRLQGHPRPDLD